MGRGWWRTTSENDWMIVNALGDLFAKGRKLA